MKRDIMPYGKGAIEKPRPKLEEIETKVRAELILQEEIIKANDLRIKALQSANKIKSIGSERQNQKAIQEIGKIKAIADDKGEIDQAFDYFASALHKAHSAVTGLRGKWKKELKAERERLGQISGDWDKKQEAIRLAEKKKREEAAAKAEAEEREKMLAEAARLEEEGHNDLAEITLQEAENLHVGAPPEMVPPRKIKTDAGKKVEFKDVYYLTITNEEKLIRWLARSDNYDCLQFKKSKVQELIENQRLSGVYDSIGIRVSVKREAR